MVLQLPNNLIGRDYIKAKEIVTFLLENGLHTIEEKGVDKLTMHDLYNEENKQLKKVIIYLGKIYLEF